MGPVSALSFAPRPSLGGNDDDFDTMTFASNDSFMDLASPDSAGNNRFFAPLPVPPEHRRRRSSATESIDSQTALYPAPSGGKERDGRKRRDMRIVTDSSVLPASASGRPPLPPLPLLPQPPPKPSFHRSASAGPSGSASHSASAIGPPSAPPMPPTTNFLNAHDRAELVRKSRKLTQLFGVTPSLANAHQTPLAPHPHARPPLASAFSPDGTRRFSAPPSPREVQSLASMLSEDELRSFAAPSKANRRRRPRRKSAGVLGGEEEDADASDRASFASASTSSSSFMDLSDNEDPAPNPDRHRRSPSPSPSRLSVLSSSTIATVDREREARRRQRDRLAKLHRFLGSRVPADLVLNLPEQPPDLPSPSPSPCFEPPHSHPHPQTQPQTQQPEAWKRLRRRSSSAAEMKTRWFDDGARVKADLDEREKAINVRRALKMEKLFGVPPPQTLYHTRNMPSPIGAAPAGISHSPSSASPSPVSPTARNINRTAYIGKGKAPKTRRLSSRSTDSTANLLHDDEGADPFADEHALSLSRRASSVYMQYRHSLNSLGDMISRDDKESLAEIHQYLTSSTGDLSPVSDDSPDRTPTTLTHPPAPASTTATTTSSPAPASSAETTTKALRRRSLPTRASSLSLASQFSLAEPPQTETFQARRRRAAKLTHFFGVDYRALVGDILASIEADVQEERSRGGLGYDEAQDLLQKLRKLKTKRTGGM